MGASPSEATLRQAALAAFTNARELHGDARLLMEQGRASSALALARIGVEEFGKAIAYTVAAAYPPARARLKVLPTHEPKQFAADMVEGALCVLAEGWAVIEQEAPYPMTFTSEHRLLDVLAKLIRTGLDSVFPSVKDAKDHYGRSKPWDGLRPPDLKNAALYVDIGPNGEVLTPERVAHHATSGVLGA
jgi:AbiV family abortive infection protein